MTAEALIGAAAGVAADRTVKRVEESGPLNITGIPAVLLQSLSTLTMQQARLIELTAPGTPYAWSDAIATDGSGDAVIVFGPYTIPLMLNRVAFGISGGATTANVMLYRNEISPMNILDAIGPVSGGAFTYGKESGLFLPIADTFVLEYLGGSANMMLGARIQFYGTPQYEE